METDIYFFFRKQYQKNDTFEKNGYLYKIYKVISCVKYLCIVRASIVNSLN